MALSENWENFIRLHDGKIGAQQAFEELMFEVLQIENSEKEVHATGEVRDTGVDIFVHQEDGVHAYQCKFYIDSMNSSRWNQIKNSYDRAVTYYSGAKSEESRLNRWYICMPCELQKEDIDKWVRFCDERKAYGIETYLIDGNEIIQRMKACDRKYGTDLIARYFAATQLQKRAIHTIPRFLTPIPVVERQLDLVGRESLVEQVITRLESKNSVIALSGVGGIGKTAVMRQVCNTVAEKGHYVAWIDCSGRFKEDILGLGDALGVAYENADSTYRMILRVIKSQLPEELYLFFDDLESPLSEDEIRDLASLNAHIMITSRHHHKIAFTIDLDILSAEDALNMFFHYYNENRNREYEGTAKIIIDSVNRNTLLVELLAKAARKTGGTLESFSERLANEGFFNATIQKINVPHDGYQKLTIEQSVMKLYALSHLSEEQQRIMKLFSIFTPEKEIFWELPEWAGLDMDAVDELVDLGWLETTGSENNYIIHQIISDSLKIQLQKQSTEVKLEEYGSLLSKVADIDKYMPEDLEHAKVRERLVLAEDVARFFLNRTDRIMEREVLPEDSAVLKSAAVLYDGLAGVLYNQGEYEKALKYYRKAFNIYERVSGTDRQETARTYNNMALVYSDQGDYERALEYYGKALTIRERVLGSEHPDTATTYNNMAGVYSDQGDYERALEYYRKALTIRERVLGRKHPDTTTTYNNLAGVYYHQGDYERALEYYRKALTIRERVLGREHPSTATTYYNIAGVFLAQGDYERTLECYGKALAIQEKVLGCEHPSTATTYNNMALVYSNQGDYERALEYYGKALAIQEKVLGREHPSTAMTYNNMAVVYSNQGNYARALEYYEKALAIRERVLGTEHPNTGTTYDNMALLYLNIKNYEKAQEYLNKAVVIRENVLGLKHPDTAMTYNNMARVLFEEGDYAEAMSLYEKALDICERALGPDHLLTSEINNNIAKLLCAQGSYVKAVEFFRRSLAVAERVLGTKNQFTVEIYHNLASTYTSLKDYVNAEKYYLLAISAYEIEPDLPRQDYILLLKNIAGVYYQQLAYDKSLSYFVKALNAYDENSELMDDQGYYVCKMIAEIYTKLGKFNEAAGYQEKAQKYNREHNYSRSQEPTVCQIELLTIIAKAKADRYSKSFLLNLLGEERITYEDAVLRLSLEGWVIEENGSLYLDHSLSSDFVIPDNYRLESEADFYRKLLLNYMALPYEQINLYSKSVLPVILGNLQGEDSDEKFAADIMCNMDRSNEQFISKYPDCDAACFYIDSRNNTRKYGFYDIAQNRFISIYECTIKSDENEINLLKAHSRALFKLDFSVIDKEGRISEIPD